MASSRRSYSGLMRLPAYWLMDGEKLVASIRAESAQAARLLFKQAGLNGTRVKRGT